MKFNNCWLGSTDTAYEGACLFAAHLASLESAKSADDLRGKADRWTAADEQVLMTMCSTSPPATWEAIGTVLRRTARSVSEHASELRRLRKAPIALRPPGRVPGAVSTLAINSPGPTAPPMISGSQSARTTLPLPTAVATDLGDLPTDPSIPTAVGVEYPMPYVEMPVPEGGVRHSVVAAALSGPDDPPPVVVHVQAEM